jgi:ribosome assembly protein YihI (activator of Der GTPase)
MSILTQVKRVQAGQSDPRLESRHRPPRGEKRATRVSASENHSILAGSVHLQAPKLGFRASITLITVQSVKNLSSRL